MYAYVVRCRQSGYTLMFFYVSLFAAAIMDLIKNLMSDDIPDEQSLFRYVKAKT